MLSCRVKSIYRQCKLTTTSHKMGTTLGALVLLLNIITSVYCDLWTSLNLPGGHIPYYFFNNPDVKQQCQQDPDCPFKKYLEVDACWGHENTCKKENRMQFPQCDGPAGRWTKSKDEQYKKFWEQGDFGYIRERVVTTETICSAEKPEHSFLECSDNARYCYGRNIYFDFSTAKIKEKRKSYREDIISKGQVGGHCAKFYSNKLKERGNHKSPLQSWYAELEHFVNFNKSPLKSGRCDIIYDKPTVVFKLDAAVNMYHHFCDFVNLYAAQHINNSFSDDIHIVNWDTSSNNYFDMFGVTWDVFTKNELQMIRDFEGKRVCFREVMFPLLARNRLGLYYNMPVIPGCHGSSLFKAFHEHVIHRLKLKQDGPLKRRVRVTLLSRGTKYRNILNEDELVKALKAVGDYKVRVVKYNRDLSFIDQLKITLNSDVFMGMHGAGLTHGLFQPDWGALFEIYNCDDVHCYNDLARLRGLGYFTWEKIDKLTQEDEGHHPTLGAHKKFTNYAFDVNEFMRMVRKCADHVLAHPAYIAAREAKFGKKKDEL